MQAVTEAMSRSHIIGDSASLRQATPDADGDDAKWQALWDGPDTVETQKRVVAMLQWPLSARFERANDYLSVLSNGLNVNGVPLSILENACQRSDRLKSHGAPKEWVKRAVEEYLSLKERLGNSC